MKKVLAVGMIIVGILLGLYLGLWVMFVGGIVGLVEIFKSGNIEGMAIALNIVKIVFASAVGTLAAYILVIPGWVMINK